MSAVLRGLASESPDVMRARMREAVMLAGSDVVAELFAKLDQIEGPNAERPIVTIACFADNTQRLEIDMVRLGKIRATVSPEAWRLLCDVYFPNAIGGAISGEGALRRLFDG